MISEELDMSLKEAESFKLSNAFKVLMEKKNNANENSRLVHRLRNEKLVLLQLMAHYAKKYGLDLQNLRNIVIAGGGAKLPTLQELIIEFFQKPCEKIGEKSFKYFLNYRINPEISCSIGLAYSSYTKRQEQTQRRTIKSVIGRYFQLRLENLLFTD
jgi:cell division ATPase FtsA